MKVSGQLHALADSPLGKEPSQQYPLNMKLGGPQRQSETVQMWWQGE